LGQILEDVEGALWNGEVIERSRVKKTEVPEFLRLVVVAIDPAVTASETSDETGIITVGMVPYWDAAVAHTDKSHAFVLDDRSGIYTPTEWGRKAVAAYKFFKGNRITGEINNGGEMVKHVIHSLEDTIPFKQVTATRGKARRAEPVSSLYAEERVHHVGMFPKLEDQMTTWDPENADDFSPDRMDAMVWGVTDTMIGATLLRRKAIRDGRLKGRR
jgi:phage terminase large subunit-like protein